MHQRYDGRQSPPLRHCPQRSITTAPDLQHPVLVRNERDFRRDARTTHYGRTDIAADFVCDSPHRLLQQTFALAEARTADHIVGMEIVDHLSGVERVPGLFK